MKNIKKFLTLCLGLGLVGGSLLAVSTIAKTRDANHVETFATHEILNDKFIPMTAGNIEGENFDASVHIRGNNPNFWSGRYYGTHEDVIDTIDIDGWRKGNIRTQEFNQQSSSDGNDMYISFLYGGNTADCFINIWNQGIGDFYANIKNDFFQDPNSSLNMCFRYFKVPNNLSGRTLIFMHDDSDGAGCGGITFSELRINQTWDDVVTSYRNFLLGYALSSLKNEANLNAYNRIKYLHENESYYADLKSAISSLPALTNVDDDFEVNNSLRDWVVDWNNTTGYYNRETIYSNASHKVDGYFTNGMPFNQHGSFFLNEDANGFPEDGKYRLVSREFQLGGVGLISAKLGGGTSVLELLDGETFEVLASTDIHGDAEGNYICNPGFSFGEGDRADLDMCATGARLNTLTRVYLDCTSYAYSTYHKTVRVALTDGRTGGDWGKAYFDDVKTNYVSYPALNVELLTQNVGNDVFHHGVITDKYVGSNSTTFGKAYAFMQDFYNVMRGVGAGRSYCSILESNEVASLLTAYASLDSDVKALVDAAVDFDFGTSATSENWFLSTANVGENVGDTMTYVNYLVNNASSPLKASIFRTNDNTNTTIMVICIVVVSTTMLLLFVIRKRRFYK